MLGRRDPQTNFFNAPTQLGPEALGKMGFYGQISAEGHRIFCDEDFSGIYCADNGRPSAPPSLLAIACLLQFYAGVSDAEVIERCRYDLRWKAALDLDPLSTEAPFAKSTFQAFRARLTLHEQEGLAFVKSIELARASGLLPGRLRVALDSSPVRGRGAVKDTFNLLSDAIVGLLRATAAAREMTAEEVADEAGLARHLDSPSIKGSEVVDWTDPEAVSEFLGGLLADCDKAFAVAEQAGLRGPDVDMLRKIIDQDVDPGDDQTPPSIRQGVAKDRSPSVNDPEMRHGCKSSGAKYTGHKAHVAVDVESGIVTAVEMGTPGQADGAQVKTLIEQTQEISGCDVEIALGDCAYSTREALGQAEEVEVELRTKMPSHRKGYHSPSDFEVSNDRKTAHCPAGHPSASQQKVKARKGGPPAIRHLWPEELCNSCPLKDQCTPGRRRTLTAPEDYHERRGRERYARSSEGRQELRARVTVEHAIGRLKNRGARAARYFGRSKTRGQWLWTAAVANLCLVLGTTAVIGQ